MRLRASVANTSKVSGNGNLLSLRSPGRRRASSGIDRASATTPADRSRRICAMPSEDGTSRSPLGRPSFLRAGPLAGHGGSFPAHGRKRSLAAVVVSLCLSDAEMYELTGYTQPAAQARWLVANGWRFARNAAGHPRVARAYFDRRMVAREAAPAVESASPDWAAISGGRQP